MHSPKVRERSDTFADHYSQVTPFWHSQKTPEEDPIVWALQFELSKVEALLQPGPGNLPRVPTASGAQRGRIALLSQ